MFSGLRAAAALIVLCAGLGSAAPAAAQSVLYVSESGSDANAGTSWGAAYRTLQHALSVASANSGTEIWIAAGTYYPDEGPGVTNDDPTAAFALVDGVDVYGGFAGTESTRSARDPEAYPTILSGDVDGNDTDPDGDGIVSSPFDISGTNSHHVVSVANASNGVQIDGVIITGGNAVGTTALPQGRGGGLYVSASTVRAANVILTGNGALEGGAAYVDGTSDLLVINSLVAVNTASSGSGFVSQGPLRLTNVLLVGHVGSPSAIDVQGGSALLSSVTATQNDGLVASAINAGITAQNSILWGNNTVGPQLQTGDSDSSVSLNHVLIQGGTSGGVDTSFGGFLSSATAVIDADPFFASPAGPDGVPGTLDDNFRLLTLSPALNAGDAALLSVDEADTDRDGDATDLLSVDLDGDARVQEAALDLGAYEGGEPPLTLTGTIPDRESTTAGPSDPIDLNFDRPVDGASVSTATLQVRGSQSGGVSGTLSGGGTATVTFTPSAPFRRGETVTVTLAPTLLGTDGVPLALPQQVAYTISTTPNAGFLTDSAAAIAGVRQGDLDWGDYDADGDLDVAVAGQNNANNPSLRIYRNDGTAGFTDVSSGLSGVTRSSVDWGDYDNDGDLDLLVTGSIDGTSTGSSTTLYQNDGGDQFSVVASGLPDVSIGDAVWGDLDGDGFLDVFITGRDPSGLPLAALYQNTGGGSFAAVGAGLTDVDFSTGAWGDLDGDRDLDLVVVGSGSTGPVSVVYRNDGGGVFTEQPAGFTGVSRGDVDLADVNGDGLLDVFLTGQDADGLAFSELHLNTGSGSFSVAASGLPGRSFGATAAFGDVDGDGDRDALVAGRVSTGTYGAGLYINDGTGVFTNAGLTLPAVAESAAAFGDVEGDGDLDLLLGGARTDLSRVASVFTNVAPPSISVSDAVGSIADGTTINLGVTDPATPLTETITVTNNAGAEADLVISGAAPSNTDFFSLTLPSALPVSIPPGGSATFDLTLSASTEGFYTTGVEIGSNDPAQNPFVFFAEGAVAAPALSEVRPSSGASGTPVRIRGGGLEAVDGVTFGGTTASVDSVGPNGRVIYTVVPTGVSGTVDVGVSLASGFSGTLPGAFTAVSGGPGFFQDAAAGLSARSRAASDWADYDGDGDLDLFLTGADAGGTPVSTLYRNEGSFSLVDSGIAFPGLERGSVSWGDYDRDGDPDLFLSGLDATAAPQIRVYRNDGSGTFTNVNATITPVRDGGSDWGDYDGDGDLDLAVTGFNTSGNRIARIYEQVDPDVFTALSASLSPAAQGDVEWGDLDGDGLLDLLLSDGVDGGVDLYRNDGEGFFQPLVTSLPTLPLQTGDLGDVDADGDLDLLLAGGETSTSASADVFLNDGTGAFTALGTGLVPVERSHGRFGDIDGDGDLDIVLTGAPTGTSQTQEARVYRNDGGTFTAVGGRFPAVVDGATDWADADQDGDLDLLLAGSGRAGVFENLTPPEVALTVDGATFPQPPPGAVPLGTTPVGTDRLFPVVIENTAGTADGATLVVDNAAVTGDAALSLEAGSLPIEIVPGATATVNVRVDGGAAGAYTGSVDLQTNAPGTPIFSLPVEAQVLDALTATPSSVAFGTAPLGSGADASVTLQNPNPGTDVTVTSLQIQGANPGDFGVDGSGLPITIAGGSSATVAVTMVPQATGTRTAELAVDAEAGGTAFPTLAVPLDGTGSTTTATALDFGLVEANAGARVIAKTVTNYSTLGLSLTLPDVRIEGANAAQFAITNAPAPSTEITTSADVEVTFQPTSTGSKTAELVIEKQLLGISTISVERIPLQGDGGSAPVIASTGTPASITTTTADVTGDVSPGGSSTTVEFQVVPVGTPFGGTGMLTFAAAESPLTGFATATATGTLTGLSPYTEYDVRIAATNTFGTTSGPSQTFITQSVPVTLSPTSPIGLGPVTQGGQVDQTVTVTNNGTTAISGLTLTQTAGGADFSILNGILASLAAGSSDTVTLRFAPTSPGVQSASFELTGTGIQPVAIDLSGDGTLLAPTVAPTTADLGTVALGTAASTTFTFENPGTDGALADGLTLTQTAGSGDFAVINDILGTVGVGSTDSFVIEATPSTAGTQTATFEITGANIAPVSVDVTVTGESPNQAPTPASDFYTTDAGETLVVGDPTRGVLANDPDPDADPLTAVVDVAPTNGSLTLNSDGTFDYTPNASFSGPDSFTYLANDGTVGTPATVTVQVVDRSAFVHALDFTTTETDRVDLPAAAPTGAVTYSAWVYPRSLGGTYNTLLEFGDDAPWFGVRSDGSLDFWPNGGSLINGGTVPLNQWTHVAYTWDGTTHRLYVDGRPVATSTATFVAPGSLSGGMGANQGGTPWDGIMDDVAVWKRARTQAEIQADLAGVSTSALSDPDLAGYFAFDSRRQDVRNQGTGLADGILGSTRTKEADDPIRVAALDRAPLPTVVGIVPTVPGAGAAVDSSTAFTITLSVPVSPVNASTVILESATRGPLAATRTGAGTATLTLTPDAPLAPGDRVTVRVTDGVLDANNRTVAPVAQSFDVQPAVGGAFFVDAGVGLSGVESSSGTWADVDGDGDLDVLLMGREAGGGAGATLYENTGGSFSARTASGLESVDARSADWADVDGDGDLDVAVASSVSGSRTAAIYLNDGTGTFSTLGAGLAGVEGGAATFGDVDGDGDPDLLLTGLNSSGVRIATIYVNDLRASGGFIPLNAGLTGVRLGGGAWADVDADGDLDLAITGLDGGGAYTATIYRNDELTFTPLNAGLTGVRFGTPAWGDVDGDGDPDLVVPGETSTGTATTAVYRNDLDAGGGFTPINLDANGTTTGLQGTGRFGWGAAAWGDADGDGDLDLALTGRDGAGNVGDVFLNDGTGAFTPSRAGVPAVNNGSVAWGDADADGDLDLVLTGNDGAGTTATLYRNAAAPQLSVSTGGATLSNGQPSPVNLGTSSLGTDLTQTFTLANTGAETDLTVQGITASNTDFYQATPSTPVPLTLAPGETATFDVTLSGATAGTQTSTVSVESDDPDDAVFTFPVTGTIADNAPIVAVNAGLTLDQGTTAPIDATLLQAADTDTPDGSLVFALTSAPINGALQVNGTTLVAGETFTQADLNSGSVSYAHNGSTSSTDAFSFTVTDGTSTTAEATFTITVTPVNAAPTISSIAGPTIDEDTGTGALAFTVGDAETASSDLTLSATSDAPGLLPDANLTLTGPDADGNATITAVPTADSSGSAAVTVTVSDGSATATSSFTVTVSPVNDAPMISSISDRLIQEDAALGAAAFTVSDVESVSSALTITATSDNPTLLPEANLTLTGPDADGNASLAAVPVADGNGTAGIAITVSDGSATATSRFSLVVTPVNDAPVLSAISDQTINEDAPLGPIAFTLRDVDTPLQDLTLTATSDAPDLLPRANLQLGGTGEARTLEGQPLPDSSGTATLEVVASDANATVRSSFVVTVQAAPDPPTAVAGAPVGVTETAATLTGSVNPNDGETTVQFVYVPDGNPGAATTIPADESPLTGSGAQSVEASVTGLQPDTRYTVRVDASNAAGTTSSEPVVFQTLNPLTVLPTASLGFGDVGVGSTRLRTVTLENTGADPLTVTGLSVTGAPAFTVQDPGLPQTLDVGTTLNVEVQYAPTAEAASETAELAVTADLENETLALTGTATAPPVARFGRIAVGPAVTRSLTVQNPLRRSVTVQDLTITDDAAGVFTVGTDLVGQTIAAEGSASIPVTLQADASVAAEATLSVVTDRGTQVIRLRTRAIGVTAQGSSDTPVPEVGQTAPVDITVPDTFEPTRVTLFYRPAGTVAYQSLDLTSSAALRKSGKAVLQADIPAEAVTETGVQYYVEAVDETDAFRVTFPGTTPDTAPAGLATDIPLVAATGPIAAETYRMYSVPVTLREPVADLLQRRINFGPYDPVRWRAFRYPPSLDLRRSQNLTLEDVDLQEFPDIDSLDVPGTAFWHVTAVEDSLRAVNARSADPSVPQTIRLQPGWNQIGNPFLFPIPWSAVIDSTLADPSLDAAAREAVEAVGDPVYWTGTAYRFGAAVLAPWEGYFVYNPTPETPVRLTVPPVPAVSVETPASVAALAAKQVASDPADAYRVQLRTSLRSEAFDTPLVDAQNWIGILPNASDGRGPEDVAEAPPVGNYVRLSILREDAPYDVLAGSFKAPGTDGHAWDVEVAAQVEEPYVTRKTVTIDLLEEGPRPAGFNLYVLDLDERRMLPTEGGRVRLPLNRDRPRARLRVIAGTKAYAEQNSDGIAIGIFETRLRGNYPNPVASETRIVYELQKQSDVHLTVYDLLGRRIARLVEGETKDAGPHEVVWNARLGGRPIASGVYFYRLRAGGVTDTGKLVVIR